ncbi:hypothetical protein PHLCEN_2v5082 [Hermanssonia centrifuga]|uniref:Mediator of RNA polymerase II transcription subunit 19 n=1 Tax=Hermanssonia centrifuga TaxID=98765 RepID=A0A2R6PBW7_9APHY|nr:hypothetical protein PHLCEN_2v5082 [Hermanssonia centrifuga]
MDVDEANSQPPLPQSSPKYNLQPTNTLAGPSNNPDQPPLPPIFLPPLPGHTSRRAYFTSTQDLLAQFQLLPAYDKYVRPYATPVGIADTGQFAATTTIDKGKGKEKEILALDPSSPTAGQTPGGPNDGDDDDGQGKGEKKWKNNYKHLIKGVPGKHSMKKDDYLMTMMQIPPKQRIAITPFDLRTQREAFSVSLEGLKGWNINALVAESPQAREDRKRRKEMKKLAKTQSISIPAPTGTPLGPPATPAPTAVGTPGVAGHQPAPVRTGTPRPGGLPASRQNQQSTSHAGGQTPTGVGTPRAQPTSHATASGIARHTPAPTPASTPGGPMDPPRGVKRERESSVGQVNGQSLSQTATQGVMANTNGVVKSAPTLATKLGTAVPRPFKKQRVIPVMSSE